MTYFSNYTWVDFYLENDKTWFENSLNWESLQGLFLSDMSFFDYILYVTFSSLYVSSLKVQLSASADLLLPLYLSPELSSSFYWLGFMLDNLQLLKLFFSSELEGLQSNFKSLTSLFAFSNPELIFALRDWKLLNFDRLGVVSYDTSTIYNSYSFTLLSSLNFFGQPVKNFLLFVLFIVIFISFLKSTSLASQQNFFLNRVLHYFYSFAKVTRSNFNLFFSFWFFALFYWMCLISNYDETAVEFIELLNTNIFYVFIFGVIFLLFKYSVHYFSFLEASILDGKTSSSLVKQFCRDLLNTFALFLRFFLLFFRLNVYDGLDDFVDSYYIFFCDFDEDHYYDELFLNFQETLFYMNDNADDATYGNIIETDLSDDLFQKYFVVWGKAFMFWFFIIEELARILLALYVTYLVIFEIQSTNSSYLEDNFAVNAGLGDITRNSYHFFTADDLNRSKYDRLEFLYLGKL